MAGILTTAIDCVVNALFLLIVIRVVLSLVRFSRRNVLTDLVYTLTEPLLAPIRSLLRKTPLGGTGMSLDLSPLVLFLLITLVRNIILGFISM
ncbi:MAG: YggT family protein [Clostridiales bacterium]|jgi:YggT family protein|nr:YggT family protein [Clostridiales bacterium]